MAENSSIIGDRVSNLETAETITLAIMSFFVVQVFGLYTEITNFLAQTATVGGTTFTFAFAGTLLGSAALFYLNDYTSWSDVKEMDVPTIDKVAVISSLGLPLAYKFVPSVTTFVDGSFYTQAGATIVVVSGGLVLYINRVTDKTK